MGHRWTQIKQRQSCMGGELSLFYLQLHFYLCPSVPHPWQHLFFPPFRRPAGSVFEDEAGFFEAVADGIAQGEVFRLAGIVPQSDEQGHERIHITRTLRLRAFDPIAEKADQVGEALQRPQ